MESDERLWERLVAGDMAAFERLYERYERPLFGFVHSFVGSDAEAEDVFHEAFLIVLEERPPARLHFRAWLYQTARNLCLNRLRSRTRGSRASERLSAVPEALPSQEEALLMNATGQALAQAVARLPSPLAEVYHLRAAGMSYSEMADTLAIPLGTVKSRMHEVVTQLKKEMEPWTAH